MYTEYKYIFLENLQGVRVQMRKRLPGSLTVLDSQPESGWVLGHWRQFPVLIHELNSQFAVLKAEIREASHAF
jgi:hypothetical protein